VRDTINLLRTPQVALGTTVNDQMALRLLVDLLQPGDTFLDIGSHIGSVIAEVRHRRPNCKVIGFEAIPEKVAFLQRKFPGVQIHSGALADHVGEATFFIDREQSGFSGLARRPNSAEITVPLRRLDDLVDHADYIKIDVEGAELGVLQGAEELVQRSSPIIMFESGPGNLLGFTKEAMFDWFAKRNYGLMVPNRLAGTGGPMSMDAFIDSHEYPRRTTNYFALPHHRFEEVRAQAKAVA
jgi:FkbM family methyltransferase